MKFFAPALIVGLVASPAAFAQGRTPMPNPAEATPAAPAAPAVGATVFDTAGGTVGTIESISGAVAVINTGTAKVGYPLASMTPTAKGPVIPSSRKSRATQTHRRNRGS